VEATIAGRNIRDGNWHPVALTYDGAQTAQLFINGSLETSATRMYITHIGNRGILHRFYGNGSNEPYDGLVDEVTIFNRCLSLFTGPTFDEANLLISRRIFGFSAQRVPDCGSSR
jgi:Concanavalin A-like lectin/glucanases superfamily